MDTYMIYMCVPCLGTIRVKWLYEPTRDKFQVQAHGQNTTSTFIGLDFEVL